MNRIGRVEGQREPLGTGAGEALCTMRILRAKLAPFADKAVTHLTVVPQTLGTISHSPKIERACVSQALE